jgi:hypothetical protein
MRCYSFDIVNAILIQTMGGIGSRLNTEISRLPFGAGGDKEGADMSLASGWACQIFGK